MRHERELIRSLDAPRPIQADLLAVAVMIGVRFFARELVEAIFAEEMQMLKESSFIEEWIEEGETRATRSFLLRQFRRRFGVLPDRVVEQIETADREWCEVMGERLLDATSLEELGFGENGTPAS